MFNSGLPKAAGLSLEQRFYQEVISNKPKVAWWEIAAEDFFGIYGAPGNVLNLVAEDYPLSVHNMGLSIGSIRAPNEKYLCKLKRLVDFFKPRLMSDHLIWNEVDGMLVDTIIPLPYTEEYLQIVTRNINQIQNYLGQQILIENYGAYFDYHCSIMTEDEFISEILRITSCGLLLDINNLYITAHNCGFDAYEYLCSLPESSVKEFHIGGSSTIHSDNGVQLLINERSNKIPDEIWQLYKAAVYRFGPQPTLIECKESNSIEAMLIEANKANIIMEGSNDVCEDQEITA